MGKMLLKIKETLSWKKTSILLLFAVFLLISIVVFQHLRLDEAKRISKEYSDKINYQEEVISETKSRLPVSMLNITNQSMSEVKSGWLHYENESIKVRFEYPLQFIKLQELIQEDVWSLSLLSKRTKNFSDQNISLAHLSNKLSPATYGNVNTPEKVIVGKYKIDGKKYDAWIYVMGEGGACGGGSIRTEVIKLREDLYLHLETLTQQKNVNADCLGNEYDEIKTPGFELDLVSQILGTIEFE